jgi:DNA-directed RNA polymerase alpha subunit
MLEERRCKNCQFWLRQSEEDVSGQCRRYPPDLPQIEAQLEAMQATGASPFVGVWPDTLGLDWCGEFQAKESDPAETRELATLGLSTRTVNSLEKGNVRTVRDLLARTAKDLKAIRNFGDAALKEVQDRLAANGLSLRKEKTQEPQTTRN